MMKRKQIKKSFIGILLGVLLGLIFGYIASKLSIKDTVMLVVALVVNVIAVAFIIAEDIDTKIRNAYIRGRQEAMPRHANCRCTMKLHKKDI